MRELIESIRQMNESTISETRDYTKAELESLIDDANAVMDELDGHEQEIVQSAIEDIVAAIESDDLVTASEFAEDILDIIAGEDVDDLEPEEDFDDEEIIDIDEAPVASVGSTAQGKYYATRDEVIQLIHQLNDKISDHQKAFQRSTGTSWGYVGDLVRVKEKLSELVAQFN